MTIVYVLFFVFLMSMFSLMFKKAEVTKCHSRSCKHNAYGNCKKPKITIYDNGVLGLCLDHTEEMSKRVTEPLAKGIQIGMKVGEANVMGQIIKKNEIDSITKDEKGFNSWLKRHGIG